MRTEINVLTGEITEHEDAPVTWEVTTQVEQPKPTVEQLQAQLAKGVYELFTLAYNLSKESSMKKATNDEDAC